MGDRYTITERVDQGGMAEVFRGVAESMQGFKKSVAIKRILPNLTKNKKFEIKLVTATGTGLTDALVAYDTTTYPAKPGPLCRRYCPVAACPHHGESSY